MLQDPGKVLLLKIQEVKENNNVIDITNLNKLIDVIAEVVKNYIVSDNDVKVFEELKSISSKFREANNEIIASNIIKSQNEIKDASLELVDISSYTESSTNVILDNIEKIQALTEKIKEEEIKKEIIDLTLKITESCGFQDLAGQKIKKVVTIFENIEQMLKKVATIFGAHIDKYTPSPIDPKSNQALLNGPQLKDKAPSQKDIDDLFDNI